MKKEIARFFAVGTAYALAISALVASLSVQRDSKAEDSDRRTTGNPSRPVKMPAWSVPPPQMLAPADPTRVYKVEPIPVRGIVKPRTPQHEQDLKDAAVIVSDVKPIPAERIQFFDWMNAEGSPVTFAGWGVFVQSVMAVPQGRLITLRVSALSTPKGVNNNFIEEYLWANGRLHYIKGYGCPILGDTPSISGL